MSSRLREKYRSEVVNALKERYNYSSVMQVPKIEKVVLNMGLGEAVQNSRAIQNAEYALTQIAGQKPRVNRSKKSIAAFKVRAGVPVGLSVTLRRDRMYDFLDRLIAVALPRVKDFRGVSRKGFDGRGNYTLGITDQSVFPEVDFEKLDKIRGMDVSIVTSATNDEQALSLLEVLGIPFRKVNEKGTGAEKVSDDN
jgi:large subunit ribosomal protein L5